jgi:hypothetical protein
MSREPDQGKAQKISLGLFKEFLKQGTAGHKEEKSLLEKSSNLGIEHARKFIEQLKEKNNDSKSR